MNKLNSFSKITSDNICRAKEEFGTPIYLYDEYQLMNKCRMALSMPSAYGLIVRYSMKANSNRSLLQLIYKQGIVIDASSLNEAIRAHTAGVNLDHILLTSQEVPENTNREQLEKLILNGLKYNVCSLRQLFQIGDFARNNQIDLSIRIHPGFGSGESASRNTGDSYACFGIHLSEIDEALKYADERRIRFTQIHTHIGSGADPKIWRKIIDFELSIIEKYFPHVKIVSFGGGLKEARMPKERAADLLSLGLYAKQRIIDFYQKTGRKLIMEIEPGTFIIANSGYIITKVLDKKRTGTDGFNFVIVDGGMELNTRPLMYGSKHPFYIIASSGDLLFSEFESLQNDINYKAIIVGICCETGDSQCLNKYGKNIPRIIVEPNIGDIVVIGGTGAYCSSMSPFNYNSHTQIPEVLFTLDGHFQLLRKRQTLEQVIQNEI